MRKFNGFSLMEMMVVLLIVAIVMAASAPMISKRMIRTAEGGSPWLFSGMNGSIFFNGNDNNRTAMIGRSDVPAGGGTPRLLIDAGRNDNTAALSIYRDGDFIANLIARKSTIGICSRHTGSAATATNSVYIGTNQTINANSTAKDEDGLEIHGCTVAIGDGVTADDNSIAIGQGLRAVEGSIIIGTYGKVGSTTKQATSASPNTVAIGQATTIGTGVDGSIAIGQAASVSDNANDSIAIGQGTTASGLRSLAIGGPFDNGGSTTLTTASGDHSIAIGNGARATQEGSIAIGDNVNNTRANVIQLGTENQIVYIPGNLVVGKNSVLGYADGYYRTWVRHKTNGKNNWHMMSIEVNKDSDDDYRWGEGAPDDKDIWDGLGQYSEKVYHSDRRLKNVGEMFTGGLEQVKKLEVYNFTYKKDSANTPRVGVMAQDLMKVFPNAVTKGEDGYLRIRMEDMFYAVVNAVKELDNKLIAIVEQLKTIADDMSIIKNKNTEYEREITELVEQNKALMKKNAEFEERLAKLEGKAIKKETKEMTKSVKQESKLAKQEEKAKLKAQKQAEKEAQKAAKKAEKEGKK